MSTSFLQMLKTTSQSLAFSSAHLFQDVTLVFPDPGMAWSDLIHQMVHFSYINLGKNPGNFYRHFQKKRKSFTGE